MAKSDSTRKPLPKVWVRIDPDGEARDGFATKPKGPSWLESGDALHQYAPVQPPRRCVWEMHPTMGRIEYTGCGSGELVEGGYLYKFCPYCGGKIVRRKS